MIFEYLAEKHCHLMKSVKVHSLDVIVDSDGQGKFIFDAVHRYPSLYYEAPFDAQRLYSNLCHMRLEDNFHVYWAVDPEPLFTALAQLPSVIFGGNMENISFGGIRSDESGNVISQFIRQHSSIRSIRLQNEHTKEDIEKMARSIRNPVCFSVVSCMEMSRSSTPISDDILQHFLQRDTN